MTAPSRSHRYPHALALSILKKGVVVPDKYRIDKIGEEPRAGRFPNARGGGALDLPAAAARGRGCVYGRGRGRGRRARSAAPGVQTPGLACSAEASFTNAKTSFEPMRSIAAAEPSAPLAVTDLSE